MRTPDNLDGPGFAQFLPSTMYNDPSEAQAYWSGRLLGETVGKSVLDLITDHPQAIHRMAGLARILREQHQGREALSAARTELAQTQLNLELAGKDTLTGLATRATFMQSLERRIAQAIDFNEGSDRFGLIFLDLDNFKPINDNYGHAAGDNVLAALGKQIDLMTRETDIVSRWHDGQGNRKALQAGRYGGDEIVVLVDVSEEPRDPDRALNPTDRLIMVADRLRHMIGYIPQSIAGLESTALGASIGIALWQTGVTADELIHYADVAMYTAKHYPHEGPKPIVVWGSTNEPYYFTP